MTQYACKPATLITYIHNSMQRLERQRMITEEQLMRLYTAVTTLEHKITDHQECQKGNHIENFNLNQLLAVMVLLDEGHPLDDAEIKAQ